MKQRHWIIMCCIAIACGVLAAVAGGLGVMGSFSPISLVFGSLFAVMETALLIYGIIKQRIRRKLDQIGWPD